MKENVFKQSRLTQRHSNFGAMFKVKRDLDGSHKIVNNPQQVKFLETNQYNQQMKKPIRRKEATKHAPIYKKNLEENDVYYTINIEENLQGSLYFMNGMEVSYQFLYDNSLKEQVKSFSNDFMEYNFNPLIESLYDEIYSNSVRVQDQDKIQYLILIEFGLAFTRNKYYNEKYIQRKHDSNINMIQVF